MTDLMTTDELSNLIHTPVKTLEYWRAIGKGPAYVRLPRRVLYPRVAVDDWLTSNYVTR